MEQQNQYLLQAEEADKLAAEAQDLQLRRTWQRIADSYRDLARLKSLSKPPRHAASVSEF